MFVRSWRRPSSDIRFCLVFEREKLSVPVMRQVLGDTLRGVGVSEDSVADILLAVTEACTNVVLHAGPAGAYEVTTTVGRSGCQVEVCDNGQGCRRPKVASGAPSGLPQGDRGAGASRSGDSKRGQSPLWEIPEHGRGIAIMRACMDEVTLRSVPGHGTSVVLDKRIRWDAPLPMPA